MTRTEAEKVRSHIESAASYLPDDEAFESAEMFPAWKKGKSYSINDRVRYEEKLYKCLQAHTSQDDWTPDITPALWSEVVV